jgi:glyoxylase-like metal-dependent hydrolase (beta-lactamase superfamily II)
MATWRVGNVEVTRIEEQLGFAKMPPDKYFRGFEREVFDRHLHWLEPNHYSSAEDKVITSIHSWLVRTPRHTILVDSCAGNHKTRPWSPRFHQLNTPFLKRLGAHVQPEEIDFVCCTHLHADHVGWNTRLLDGRWVPTFPRAKYIFSRVEHDIWDPRHNPAALTDPRREMYLDSVLPIVEAGHAVLVEDGHSVDDTMHIEAASGHTPGHYMLRLESGGHRSLFCGDVIHHAIQVYAPHWNHMADEDPTRAAVTRRGMLEDCAEQGSLLFPTHFGAPHVARIHETNNGFVPTLIDESGQQM